MDIQVKLFATLRDRAGSSHVTVELPDKATVAVLLERLAATPPQPAPPLATRVGAINHGFAL